MTKHHFCGFLVHIYIWAKLARSCCPDFEINGHGASVWCHCNVIHIKGWNFINLAHQEHIWLRGCDKTSLLRFFWYIYISGQNWRDPADPTFEIIGYGAFVLCHFNDTHIKGLNLINLAHQEHIWIRGCDKTSLLRFFGIYIYIWAKLARSCGPDFWNKWSWVFCAMLF